MSVTREAIDHTALGWIKPELDEILRQTRHEIEAYAEAPAETARIGACIDFLHQVQGTLRMVELYGPAMVASEMEALAVALRDDAVGDRDEACATLMRGVVVLPDYLERLQSGHRDVPVVLLPVLNELRAARGAGDLGEDVLNDLAASVSADERAHAEGSISGRNRELLDTVAAAIKDDLLRIKDALDLHLRAGQGDIAALEPQVEALGRVGDTLAILGLGGAQGLIEQQQQALRSMLAGELAANEDALLDVAGALLYVDATLDEQVRNLGASPASAADDPLGSESRKVLEVLVREAISNFSDARQAFVGFVETSWDTTQLTEVPRLLDEVGGALRMLDLPRSADYLTGVRRYTQEQLIARRRVPSGPQLDTLADALASLEYYLEALRDSRANRDEMLEIARSSLEALDYWPLPAELAAPMQPEEPVAIDEAPIALDEEHAQVAAPTPAPDLAETAPPVAATVPVPISTAAPAAGGFDVSNDDIDDEIREVFLEEFEEEIANLSTLMPVWSAEPEALQHLRPIRRVFHTLKGSGRLVGASTLGEFSWKVESMLNRVLDNSRPPTPAVIALVEQAHAVLPELHAALRGESAISADLAGLEAVADRLAA
ncbi:MAG TPA: Hpt domain-containing protein, partial [Xanthomonadaceae bacterium]|nr:Hpt domain-containing protein [Xanthomonadaceae bacterium]